MVKSHWWQREKGDIIHVHLPSLRVEVVPASTHKGEHREQVLEVRRTARGLDLTPLIEEKLIIWCLLYYKGQREGGGVFGGEAGVGGR